MNTSEDLVRKKMLTLVIMTWLEAKTEKCPKMLYEGRDMEFELMQVSKVPL